MTAAVASLAFIVFGFAVLAAVTAVMAVYFYRRPQRSVAAEQRRRRLLTAQRVQDEARYFHGFDHERMP